MKIFLLFLLAIACTSPPQSPKKDFEIIYDLWNKKVNKLEIEKNFGEPGKVDGSYIHYFSSISPYPKTSFFFDKEQIVQGSRFFLDENDLRSFKKFIGCEWNEKEEIEDHGHYVHTIHKGECRERPLEFVFNRSTRSYEIRLNWK